MDDLLGLIFDVRKFSLHDGPGIRTTVFFKGCPLSCRWCHNPESQSPALEVMLWESRCVRCGACVPECPLGAISPSDGAVVTDRDICIACSSCMGACAAEARELVGRRVTVGEVMREVERDFPFFEESGGGVTFSGGEPLSQRAFLRALLIASKEKDIHTAVDTSGFTTWEALNSIRPYTDLFLYDLKLYDDAQHRFYTGVSNRLILSNLQALAQHAARIWVRIPVIPGINDDHQNIERICRYIAGLGGIERVDLLPYHSSAAGKYERLGKPNPLDGFRSPSEERMQELADFVQQFDLQVTIGG